MKINSSLAPILTMYRSKIKEGNKWKKDDSQFPQLRDSYLQSLLLSWKSQPIMGSRITPSILKLKYTPGH